MVISIVRELELDFKPGQITAVSWDGSLAEQEKASTLDPLLGIIAGPQPQRRGLNPTWSRGRGRAEKGVSIM